ncbi:protein YohP [Salmonella enterica subsp. enterica serovar Kingston]|nr:protein YohP [Salmonella enterica subsp. enterica serovar Kingston]
MKILLWAILIIFLIGLLVVTGVFKMIFLFLRRAAIVSARHTFWTL